MDKKPLQNQTALITGGSSGIGKGIARSLAKAGAKVIINYSSKKTAPAAEAVLADIKADGGEGMIVMGDVSKETEVKAMFATSVKHYGTIDILVNNAGLQQDAAFLDMTLGQWEKVIGVNLTGQFLCSREAISEFVKRGPKPNISKATGKIICISSVHERIPWAGHANYAASKGGIKLLMESIAQEFAPQKIRVNSIAPGAIRTPINADAMDTTKEVKDMLKLIPYGRIGDVDDIGKAAVWLASDESDYVTGATLFVDGGMSLYPGFAHGG